MNAGRVFFKPAGGDAWSDLGTIAEDGLTPAPPDVARFRVNEADRTVRAWARVGPDGNLTLGAPLIEVDPEALITAFEDSIGRQERKR